MSVDTSHNKYISLTQKLRNLGNLGNLGNIIPSFLISKFSILPYSQNRKLGFKNLGKKFPSFPSFWPGLKKPNLSRFELGFWRFVLFSNWHRKQMFQLVSSIESCKFSRVCHRFLYMLHILTWRYKNAAL